MKTYAVYKKATGEIVKRVQCIASSSAKQAKADEGVAEGPDNFNLNDYEVDLETLTVKEKEFTP